MEKELLSKLQKQGIELSVHEGTLRIKAPKGVLTDSLAAEIKAHKAALLSWLTNRTMSPTELAASRKNEPVLVSYQQRRLWFIDKFTGPSALYNMPSALKLQGRLDLSAVQQTFVLLFERHQSLRHYVVEMQGEAYLATHEADKLDYRYVHAVGADDAAFSALIENELRHCFDISSDVLIKVRLFKISDEEHLLVVLVHHLIADGWSIGNLINEFAQTYTALVQHKPVDLPELQLQYEDYCCWQSVQYEQGVWQRQLDYWRKILVSAPQISTVPTDFPRPPEQSSHGKTLMFALGKDLSAEVDAFVASHQSTHFMFFAACFSWVLSRLSSQQDLVIGTVVANRQQHEFEQTVGYFANTLALRFLMDGSQSFRDLLQQVKYQTLAAFEHQQVPFELIVDEVLPYRDNSYNPLFQNMFVWQNAHRFELTLPEVTVTSVHRESGQAKFDLTLTMSNEAETGIQGGIQFCTDLYNSATIEAVIDYLKTTVRAVVQQSLIPMQSLSCLDNTARQRVLQLAARKTEPQQPQPNIVSMFRQAATAYSRRIAVVDGECTLTYGQLIERANQLTTLIVKAGVQPGDNVCLLMGRQGEVMPAILAILQAGACYVPLDPTSPLERLKHIKEDLGQATALVAPEHMELAHRLGLKAINCVEVAETEGMSLGLPDHLICSQAPAYIIYTSGSTGKPKGVVITHQNVTGLFIATQSYFAFDEQDVWTWFHSYAFDFSVWEMWGALFYGGKIVVVPYEVSRTPELFYQLVDTQKVTVLNQTPTAFSHFARIDLLRQQCNKLRYVIFGGEALNIPGLLPWFRQRGDKSPKLVNMYGITETTVHVTLHEIAAEETTYHSSNIGDAIDDLDLYLLDDELNPVPTLVIGQLYVGGRGLASHYHNRPDLTAERFIPHQFKEGERLYRTGDLARRTALGALEYVGRCDHQVQLKGFRIELGEIEFALLQCTGVQQAVARISTGDTEPKIVGYVVPEPDVQLNTTQVFSELQNLLPDYMLPSQLIVLTGLPLTGNGKLDVAALPLPETVLQPDSVYEAPRTETERKLCEIWSEALGIGQVSRTDSYFALGGDSIKSIKLLAMARERGLYFTLRDLFKFHCLADLAGAVYELGVVSEQVKTVAFAMVPAEDLPLLPADLEDAYPLSSLQAGMIYHTNLDPAEGHYHNVSSMRLRGLRLDADLFVTAVQSVIKRHPVMRTSFHLDEFSIPLQLVHLDVTSPFFYSDLTMLSHAEQDVVIQDLIAQQKQQHFELAQAPLFRIFLQQLTDDSYQMTWIDHHIILDGWSVASFFTEIFATYLQLETGEVFEKPALKSLFRDYIAAEQAALTEEPCRTFWQQMVADLPQLRFQSTGAGESEATASLAEFRYLLELPAELSTALTSAAKVMNVPLKTICLAAHLKVIATFWGQSDVVSGYATNGRLEQEDGDNCLGLFINTLPFRINLQSQFETWQQLIQSVFELEQQMLEYRLLPMVEIQRMNNGNSLFDIMFNFISFHVLKKLDGKLDGFSAEDTEQHQKNNFTLTSGFKVDPGSEQLSVDLQYDQRKISRQQIAKLAELYDVTLRQIASAPTQMHNNTQLLPMAQWHQQLAWGVAPALSDHDSFLRCFERKVEQHPSKRAIVDSRGHELSYQQLNQQILTIAGYLRSRQIGMEHRVAICLPRRVSLPATLLGILQSGAAYVPLDPTYPAERLSAILAGASPDLVITDEETCHLIPREYPQVTLQALLRNAGEYPKAACSLPHERALAYLIFTSGSTGVPKGVCIDHGNLSALVHWARTCVGEDAFTHMLACTSICFDISAFEIFCTLANGGTLYIVDDILELAVLKLPQLKTLFSVPSALKPLLEEGLLPPGVSRIFVGGEALSRTLADLAYSYPQLEILYNLYGPSEDTVLTTQGVVGKTDNRPSLGTTIEGKSVYILDQNLSPVMAGAVGELFVSGHGVGRGYWNAPHLTAERFLPDPYAIEGGQRMYRTGDLVRFLPDGEIDYLGRADHQVKISGFRIELGEIEHVILSHQQVRDCVVVVREHGKQQIIVAYVVANTGTESLDRASLLQLMKSRLPAYMVADHIEQLSELPLLPNKKIDRSRLPEVHLNQSDVVFEVVQDQLEQQLLHIWQSVLGMKEIGRHDNFFLLGGDSILSIQIVARARKAGFQLTPKLLFGNPTLAELAKIVRNAVPQQINAEQGVISGEVMLTPVQHWFFQQNMPQQHHWNQAMILRLPDQVSNPQVQVAVEQLVHLHDMLRVRYRQVDNQWIQEIVPELSAVPAMIYLGETSVADFNQAWELCINQLHSSLDLSAAVFKFALVHFTLAGRSERRLVMIIHHLAIDTVSWRILVEDFKQLCRSNPEKLTKSTSFQFWARCLSQYAGSESLRALQQFWQQQGKGVAIPLDKQGLNSVGSSRNIRTELSISQTARLLREAPLAYNTEISDLLLVALGIALTEWHGGRLFSVTMEGHGREDLFADVDLSRTVGWFTTMYPVHLTIDTENNLAGSIKVIKEQLRQIPGKGLSYGVLKYLTQEQELSEEVQDCSFNYLGQFDQQLAGHEHEISGAAESLGMLHSEQQLRLHKLDITSAIVEQRLIINMTYSDNLHHAVTIEKLANRFTAALEQIIEHCGNRRRSFTPTDFPLAGLSSNDLEQLLADVGVVEHIKDIYPVTPLQEGLLYHTLAAPDTGAYVCQMAYQFTGAFSFPALQQAWRQLLLDVDILRTHMVRTQSGKLMQVVLSEPDCHIGTSSFIACAPEQVEPQWLLWLAADRQAGFNLLQGQLCRAHLIQINSQTVRFCLTYHHSLLDGWSMPLLLARLFTHYANATQPQQHAVDALVPYRHYIEWLSGKPKQAAQKFWQEYLLGFEQPSVITLHNPSVTQLPAGNIRLREHVSGQDFTTIQNYSRQHSLTLNTLAQAAWGLTLSYFTGSSDVVFGTTSAGRPADLPDAETMIGLFITTLPHRIHCAPQQTLESWLTTIQHQQLLCEENGYLPLQDIFQLSSVARELPLFESLMVFENYPVAGPQQENQDLSAELVGSHEEVAYPVTLCLVPQDGQLIVNMNFDNGRFSSELAEQICQFYLSVLKQLGQLVPFGQRTLGQILSNCAKPHAASHGHPRGWRGQTMIEVIRANAMLQPHAPAICCLQEVHTYAQLEQSMLLWQQRVSALASEQAIVAVCLPRSIASVEIMLGVMAAGCVYLPLDSDLPNERLGYILLDASPSVIITCSSLQHRFAGLQLLLSDDPSLQPLTEIKAPACQPHSPAYMIYTSGTTGVPKGVLLHHAGLFNTVMNHVSEDTVGSSDRCLLFASFNFDASMLEIFVALGAGAALRVVTEDERRLGADFEQMLTEFKPTWAFLPPPVLRAMSTEKFVDLRMLLTGGEVCDSAILKKWAVGRKFINCYGPTEVSIIATQCNLHADSEPFIGTGIANTEIYILNQDLTPVAPGGIGELYVSGVGLAFGYLNKPDLTAQQYIPCPFGAPGRRMYRTGDLVELRANGQLIFIGRRDSQVKIRGYRLELGDVENALRATGLVRDAVVMVDNTREDTQLVAYLVAESAHCTAEQVRTALRERLPYYMLPAVFVSLAELPLTTNGKVDRLQLQKINWAAELSVGECALMTETEQMVGQIWQQILMISEVKRSANFFELGGHSLLVLDVINQVNSAKGIHLSVESLYRYPLLMDFAFQVETQLLTAQLLTEVGLEDMYEESF